MPVPSDSTASRKRSRLIDVINPTERQIEFLRATESHDYVLYGGAAGGGKSYILRWWLVSYLIRLYRQHGLRNVQCAIFCEDYPSLFDRQISKIQFEFPPELGHLEMGTTKNFRLHAQHGGGVIALRNLDDPAKYLSAEFAGIAVDELTRNDKSVFDFLRLRLRWPGVDRPKFVGGTNPGGRGHAWVRRLWIDREFPVELMPLADRFAFVQAKASDNPHLTESYYQTLLTLPKDMAAAYAEGSWDIFAGQYFDIWDAALVRPSQEIVLKPWWPRWVSIDWGFQHCASVYWHARDDEERVITYREISEPHLGESVLGEQIAAMTGDEKIDAVFLSPDAFAKRGSQHTVAQQVGEVLQKHGLPFPTLADNDRIGGARLMYQMLKSGHWVISSACSALVKCLPTLVRDERNLEDVLKRDGDDPYDAARYGLKSMEAKGAKPLDVRIKERIEKFAQKRNTEVENLSRQTVAMMSRKAQFLERGKRREPVFRPGRAKH